MQAQPGEGRTTQLLEEAAKQYEESLRVADAVFDEEDRNRHYPEYSWNNPMGLVLTEAPHANLV